MSIEKKMENMKKELDNNLYLAYLLNTYPEKTEAQARHLIPDLKRDRDGENLLILMEMELQEIMHRIDPHDLDIISPHDELKKKVLASRVFLAKRGNVEETIEFLNNATIESLSGGKKIKSKRKQKKNTKKRRKPRKSVRKKKSIRKKSARKKSLKKNKRKTCGGMESSIPLTRSPGRLNLSSLDRGSSDDNNNSESSETSTVIENIGSNNEEQNAEMYDQGTIISNQNLRDEIDFIPENLTDKERFLHQASNNIQNLKEVIMFELEYDGNTRGQSPVLEDIDPREMRYLKELPDKLQIDGTNIFSPGTPGHESILNSYQEMETPEQIQYLTKVYERIINSYIELLVRTTDSTNESSPVRSRRFRDFRMLQLEPLQAVREIRNNRLSDTDIRSRA